MTASSDFLAADWGTSNLRAWRLGADGTVKAGLRRPWGVAGLKPGEAARKLAQDLRPALDAEGLPAILCGMVGSGLGRAALRRLSRRRRGHRRPPSADR
jgi:2-dehydro-3-deoxygalactonokinase